MFGFFPAVENKTGRFLLVAHEICRVHMQNSDYRNANRMIMKCVEKCPRNPYVLSKAGRTCLETGRRIEA